MKKLRVGLVGATGAVGKVLREILTERDFPMAELIPFASQRSEGKKVECQGRTFQCKILSEANIKDIDVFFLDASDEVSLRWVPEILKINAWVVDNSAAYRLDAKGILSVPEVNGKLLTSRIDQVKSGQGQRLISGPNCSTVQLVMALHPLHQAFGLKRVILSTYQSVSGAGAAAVDELLEQTQKAVKIQRGQANPTGRNLSETDFQPQVLTHPIAFNTIPQIGKFRSNGMTSEEEKVVFETRKILGLPELKVSVTAVRVPVIGSHSESVYVEFEKVPDIAEARRVLEAQEGVELLDEPKEGVYPMGLSATGKDPVYVGRVRRDDAEPTGLWFWCVSDNLRKGAALNAVQIGEALIAGGAFLTTVKR